MFENLKDDASGANNPNNGSNPQPNGQVPPRQPDVDDIFADTDTTPTQSGSPFDSKSEIVTKHVGLGASSNSSSLNDDDDNEKKGGKAFKIIVIVMIVVIVGLLGFLVYSKFIKSDDTPVVTDNNDITNEVDEGDIVDEDENALDDEFDDYTPLAPGEEEEDAFVDDEMIDEDVIEDEDEVSTIPVDSDGDGLTDDEELLYGTNPLLVDTDGDGLSDYEEIVIYKTNPLNPDTDGDGFTDGEEVNNGYNPNGPGLLTDK